MNAVLEYIRMSETSVYTFGDKADEKKALGKKIRKAILDHQERVQEREKGLLLFDY